METIYFKARYLVLTILNLQCLFVFLMGLQKRNKPCCLLSADLEQNKRECSFVRCLTKECILPVMLPYCLD